VIGYSREDSSIHADVEVQDSNPAPTTFMVRESWHPRWHAYLDGKEVTIRRVSPDFMAIDVPPGAHALDLRFERPLWEWLLWLLWPAFAWAGWRATREPDPIPRARVA